MVTVLLFAPGLSAFAGELRQPELKHSYTTRYLLRWPMGAAVAALSTALLSRTFPCFNAGGGPLLGALDRQTNLLWNYSYVVNTVQGSSTTEGIIKMRWKKRGISIYNVLNSLCVSTSRAPFWNDCLCSQGEWFFFPPVILGNTWPLDLWTCHYQWDLRHTHHRFMWFCPGLWKGIFVNGKHNWISPQGFNWMET